MIMEPVWSIPCIVFLILRIGSFSREASSSSPGSGVTIFSDDLVEVVASPSVVVVGVEVLLKPTKRLGSRWLPSMISGLPSTKHF